mmetsp:Transcript_17223/g.19197  ORF Transcript_17223/g.19197 Transcript_17223/m.19197 type:complete len:365 (+) Transcript_17223:13-1107(+)
MGSIFSYFRPKRGKIGAELEKLDQQLQEAEDRLQGYAQAHRTLTWRLLILFTLLELSYLVFWYFIVVITEPWERLVYLVPIVAIPFGSMLLNRIVNWYYGRCRRLSLAYRDKIHKQQVEKLEELKEFTNYYETRKLVETYESTLKNLTPGDPRKQNPGLRRRPGATAAMTPTGQPRQAPTPKSAPPANYRRPTASMPTGGIAAHNSQREPAQTGFRSPEHSRIQQSQPPANSPYRPPPQNQPRQNVIRSPPPSMPVPAHMKQRAARQVQAPVNVQPRKAGYFDTLLDWLIDGDDKEKQEPYFRRVTPVKAARSRQAVATQKEEMDSIPEPAPRNESQAPERRQIIEESSKEEVIDNDAPKDKDA